MFHWQFVIIENLGSVDAYTALCEKATTVAVFHRFRTKYYITGHRETRVMITTCGGSV